MNSYIQVSLSVSKLVVLESQSGILEKQSERNLNGRFLQNTIFLSYQSGTFHYQQIHPKWAETVIFRILTKTRVHLKAGRRIYLKICVCFSSIRMLISKVQLLFKALNGCALVNPYKLQRCVEKPRQSSDKFQTGSAHFCIFCHTKFWKKKQHHQAYFPPTFSRCLSLKQQ